MDNPNLVISLKPLVVNAWQFSKSLIETYPFKVESYYPKDGEKHYLCILDSGEVIVKEGDYIIELPMRDNDGNEKIYLMSMPQSFYLANFIEVDESDIEWLEDWQ